MATKRNQETSDSEGKSLAPLTLLLFGSFDLQVGAVRVSGCSRPVQALLTLLALRHDRAVERSWLAETVWPEAPAERARFYLRRSLAELRSALGLERLRLLSPTPSTLRLDLSGAFCDLLAFDASITRHDRTALEEAMRLYRGPLLETCDAAWIFLEREIRSANALRVWEKLAESSRQQGDAGEAVRLLHRVSTIDPLNEAGRCHLMEALADLGDLAGVERQYRELRLRLRQELNTEPSPTTTALYRRLCTRNLPPEPEPIVACAPSIRRRLPCPLTTLIGRAETQHEIVEATRSARLLTLTGIGGVGKTRLSIAVAEEIEPDYPDGVWFVDLSGLLEPTLLPQHIAQTLGIRASSDTTFEVGMLTLLRTKRLLLILDNCEHLIDACAYWVKQILAECAEVRILCTSRQPLQIAGETTWAVDPLPIPPADSGAIPDGSEAALRRFGSVALLLDRAAVAAPRFRLTPRNAAAVCQICRRLDGIPLAIELAAARLRSLSALEIAVRLTDRFQLLTTGDRTSPRHQTLLATLDWGYDLLTDPERVCLRRLSVYTGGCTLEAAEAADREALASLTSLVDKSLVVYHADEDASGRYALLETVREYALAKLRACDEWDAAHRQHRDYFLALAETAEAKLKGAEQAEGFRRFEEEHENLRAALHWSLGETELSAAIRLCGTLQHFWGTRGYLSEGREWSTRVLAKSAGRDRTEADAKVLNGAGGLAYSQGDYSAAQSYYSECLAIYSARDDRRRIALAHNNLGIVAAAQGDYASASTSFEESLKLRRESKDQNGIAYTLNNLGLVAVAQGRYSLALAQYEESLALFRGMEDQSNIAALLCGLGGVANSQGEYASARAAFDESLHLWRELGDRSGVADALQGLGNVAAGQNDYAGAASSLDEALTIYRNIGERRGIADALHALAHLAVVKHDYPAAQACFQESLRLRTGLPDRHGIAHSLEGLAGLTVTLGEAATAATLWGTGAALREQIGSPLPPRDQEQRNRELADVRRSLGEQAFETAWAAGYAFTVEQAAEFAQQVTLPWTGLIR